MVLVVSAAPALAQDQPSRGTDEVAKGLFQAGKAAYEAGDYKEALQRFQEAYDRSKRPQLLYNIGLATDRLRYNRAALEAFESYLRQVPDSENRIEVENRIRALKEVVQRENAAPEPAQPAVVVAAPQCWRVTPRAPWRRFPYGYVAAAAICVGRDKRDFGSRRHPSGCRRMLSAGLEPAIRP